MGNNRSNVFTLVFLGIVVWLFSSSCLKGNFDFKKLSKSYWKPDLAIPLVNSSMSLKNILTLSNSNNNIQVDANNFITLVYKGNLFSMRADEVVAIPDQPFSFNFSLPNTAVSAFNLLPDSSSYTLNPAISNTFNFNSGSSDSYIDSLHLKSCLLVLNLTSAFQHPSEVTIQIPDAKKNGNSFSTIVNLPAAGSNPVTQNANFDLSGYTINMHSGGLPNTLKVVYGLKLTKGNTAITSGHNNMDIIMSMSNITFSRLYGSIGQKLVAPDTDTIQVLLFNNSLSSGSFSLVNASMAINISNSFGVPIRANFEKLQGYSPNSQTPIIPITSPIFNNPLPINTPQQIGQSANSSILLTSSNSNILDALGNMPKYLIYKVDALSNPPPPSVQMQNFIQDSSRFKLDVDINLPLEGKLKDLLFQDTIQFKFIDVDELESLGLKLFFNNGFPIETKVQVYFADDSGQVLDSLLQDPVVLASGNVGADGRVTSPTIKVSEINYPEEKIQRLKQVRKIYVRAAASTYDNGNKNVKIYSDYRLDLKISGRAKLRFKF